MFERKYRQAWSQFNKADKLHSDKRSKYGIKKAKQKWDEKWDEKYGDLISSDDGEYGTGILSQSLILSAESLRIGQTDSIFFENVFIQFLDNSGQSDNDRKQSTTDKEGDGKKSIAVKEGDADENDEAGFGKIVQEKKSDQSEIRFNTLSLTCD